ncbi:MAG: MBL fold metallo-hydrolase [Bacteroidales bacterium]|nr:MBL fold metallo-hydrolase [Bacteroidales bacterium]
MKTHFFALFFTFIGFISFGQPHTFSHRTQNNHEVILLAEGQGVRDYSVLIGLTPAVIAETMPNGTYQAATNAFLVRKTNGQHILIDAGLGIRLLENLQEFDVSPEMIDKILITHLHFDHIGGLLDSYGRKVFPNAQLYVSLNDYNFFTDFSNPLNERWRETAISTLNIYRENLVLMSSEQQDITDAIQALPNFGHTPGHTVYLIDDEILIWGDMVHAMAVQMPHPTISVTFDIDNEKAVLARLEMLNFIIENHFSVAGAHIPFPGMGTLRPNSQGGFIFTPFRLNP